MEIPRGLPTPWRTHVNAFGGFLACADGVLNIGGATDKLRMSLLLPLPPQVAGLCKGKAGLAYLRHEGAFRGGRG